MSTIPPPWLFPTLPRNFDPTRDERGTFGFTFRFRVTLSRYINARNAFLWGINRINNGNWVRRKHPAGIASSAGRIYRKFMRVSIEYTAAWGYIIRVRCKWQMRPTQIATFILNEVNKQYTGRAEIQKAKWIGGKRSKRTGRVIEAPHLQPAIYANRIETTVPYIHSIVLLPPQYGKYFGHTTLDAS